VQVGIQSLVNVALGSVRCEGPFEAVDYLNRSGRMGCEAYPGHDKSRSDGHGAECHRKGVREVEAGEATVLDVTRSRRPGGGRKTLEEEIAAGDELPLDEHHLTSHSNDRTMVSLIAYDEQREQDILAAISASDHPALTKLLLTPQFVPPDAAENLQVFLDAGYTTSDFLMLAVGVLAEPGTYASHMATWLLGCPGGDVYEMLTVFEKTAELTYHMVGRWEFPPMPRALEDAIGDGSQEIHHLPVDVPAISAALQALPPGAFPEPYLSAIQAFFADAAANGWGIRCP